ncbi:MAG: sulfite exporter TauE/SafE family protein [Pseudomonadota bacterium]
MTVYEVSTLMFIGLFGGAWNAVAGGATLFTFPALMAVGLPPVVANATNYLALLPSNAAALPAFRQELYAVRGHLPVLVVVSGAGAIVGSLLLLISDPEVFTALIPALILVATLLFAFGERLRAGLIRLAGDKASDKSIYAALFVCSIYGGYFGAGLGIILLAIAQLLGVTQFHTANAIKNLLATSFTLLSILVFGLGGLIAWPQAFVMMAGSTIGGYIGGRFSKRVNQGVLRAAVILFGLVLAGVYGFRLL